MVREETATRVDVPIIPWWLVLLEGIALILLAILFFTAPGATTQLLVQILGWYWLISGIFSIVSIFIDGRQWGWKLFAGILGIIAGFIIIQHPLWSAFVVPAIFLTILAIGGIVIGIIKLIEAFSGAGWGTGILGVLSILFGLLILFRPYFGAAVFLIVIPVVALIGGIVAIFVAFQMRGVERRRVPATTYPSSAVPVTGEETRESEHHEPHEPTEPTEPTDKTM